MADWLKQTSTWLGIGAGIVAALTVLGNDGVISMTWATAASAALSAIGLAAKDRQV